MLTAKQWNDAIAAIESTRYELSANIMPKTKRDQLTRELSQSLRNLAERIEASMTARPRA
jgi:hypothetical protein